MEYCSENLEPNTNNSGKYYLLNLEGQDINNIVYEMFIYENGFMDLYEYYSDPTSSEIIQTINIGFSFGKIVDEYITTYASISTDDGYIYDGDLKLKISEGFAREAASSIDENTLDWQYEIIFDDEISMSLNYMISSFANTIGVKLFI
jgi:hypothetical protein